MYPKLSDIINDIFGTHFDFPVQTYGFFLALAFIAAGYTLYLELKRKERIGLISPRERTVVTGKPASWKELLTTAVITFLLAYKIGGVIFDFDEFRADAQEYIFSLRGSWLTGSLVTAVNVYLRYRNKEKARLDKPKTITEIIHPYQLTGTVIIVAAIAGIAGAKIFDVVEHLGEFFQDPVGVLFSFSGLTFYGGLIVAAFAVAYLAEKNNIPWPVIGDSVAPGLFIAYGTGRIGCQVSGDGCWGIVNNSPKPDWMGFLPDWMWAYDYPHNVINEGVAIPNCYGEHCHILGQPVFPTPFYETLIALFFFTLLWSLRKKIVIPGIIFSMYFLLNGTARFFVEKIRVNLRYDFAGLMVTQAEVIAVIFIITGIAGIFYFRYRHRHRSKKSPA